MIIRAAVEGDAEIIAEIYNDAVLNTTAIWNENRIDVANRIAWINSRQQAGFPVIVATDKDDTVLGYASYSDWRPWDGYRHTVEHSVYVHKDARGKGAGAALMQGLIQLAREAGKPGSTLWWRRLNRKMRHPLLCIKNWDLLSPAE